MRASPWSEIDLRPAIISDMHRLFIWANDLSSISNKEKTRDSITWDAHKKWFISRLDKSLVKIWIIEKRQTPVGQVRVEWENNRLIIDIFVHPLRRKEGIGYAAVKLLIEACNSLWPGVRLVAIVKNNNYRSNSLFRKLGFTCLYKNGRITELEYRDPISP